MSQGLKDASATSLWPSEKSASPAAAGLSSTSTAVSKQKLRSCLICRARKVRCDKQSPCSNCRRANSTCIFPSTNRPPRWASRFAAGQNVANSEPSQEFDPHMDQVLGRLRTLEGMVKELSGQLEHARATASSNDGTPSVGNSPGSSTQLRDGEQHAQPSLDSQGAAIQKQLGRMVIQDDSHPRYVSSSFWSRIDDELDGLRLDVHDLAGEASDESEDNVAPEQGQAALEAERTPLDRHAFLFRHNMTLSDIEIRQLRPLPSQIPFLLDVFSENINIWLRNVHMPTIQKMARDMREGRLLKLTPSNDALMCAIYYTAVVSLEDDDVINNFGTSKADLIAKYRLGLEYALAKADFLNTPDLALVQALGLFAGLARRHDNPRFVWMLTGLLIRIAQYVGLQRDGSHFSHLSPYEVEMRRRTWWVVYSLDIRAAQDLGTEPGIASGSFDTKLPSNINDADMSLESKQAPTERIGLTDSSFPRIYAETSVIQAKMMTTGKGEGQAAIMEQRRLLDEIFKKIEQDYLQHTMETDNTTYWVAMTVTRLTMAKMALLGFLPVSSFRSSEHLSGEIRDKLLVSAIEVAEYNDELNAREDCRHWRWVFQTHIHWYAVVYLVIEISSRPWSPLVERAWVALHSRWLAPARDHIDKNLQIGTPLRKFIHKARKHRSVELTRLRSDPHAATELEMLDRDLPQPTSSGLFQNGPTVDIFLRCWRQLVGLRPANEEEIPPAAAFELGHVDMSVQPDQAVQSNGQFSPEGRHPNNVLEFDETHLVENERALGSIQERVHMSGQPQGLAMDTSFPSQMDQVEPGLSQTMSSGPATTAWLNDNGIEMGVESWFFENSNLETIPDIDDLGDISMGLNHQGLAWYNWAEFAKGMERDGQPSMF